MNKDELKALLATMNVGELRQILEEVKLYTSSSETVESVKQVFETGHMLDFIAVDDKMILVDKFLYAEPLSDNTVRAVFSIFGITNDYELAVDIDVTEHWTFDNCQPYRFFTSPLSSYLLKTNPENDSKSYGSEYDAKIFMPIKGVSVCKLVHNVYNTEDVETTIEGCTSDTLKNINKKINSEKILSKNIEKVSELETNVEPMSNRNETAPEKSQLNESSDKVSNVLSAIASWAENDNKNRRILLNVSRCFIYKDGRSKSKTNNNFSMSFKEAKFDSNKQTLKFDDTALYNGTYTIMAKDFINGSVKWDCNRKGLTLVSEDKTYIIRISFMIAGETIDLEHETMSEIYNIFAE